MPAVDEQKKAAFQKAREAVKKAKADVNAAQQPLDKIEGAEALVGHAKGKWIGGAEKGIAAAEAALKKATTEAEREAAKKELAKWQADKEAGLKALVERQAALDAAKADEPKYIQASKAAKAALAEAEANELKAAKAILADVDAVPVERQAGREAGQVRRAGPGHAAGPGGVRPAGQGAGSAGGEAAGRRPP